MQDQLLATLREQLVAIISGTIFVFIGFASCLFGAIRRRSGARIFLWLGVWSALYGARLLIESSSVVAAVPHWIQVAIPFLRMAITYLLLPVVALVWLELKRRNNEAVHSSRDRHRSRRCRRRNRVFRRVRLGQQADSLQQCPRCGSPSWSCSSSSRFQNSPTSS